MVWQWDGSGWRWGPLGGEWRWGRKDWVAAGAAWMGMATWMWWVAAGTAVDDGDGVCGCGGGWEEGGGGASVTAHAVVVWWWQRAAAVGVAKRVAGGAAWMGMAADKVGGGRDRSGEWRWGCECGCGGRWQRLRVQMWWQVAAVATGALWWRRSGGGAGGGGGGGVAWAMFVMWCVTAPTGSRSEVVTTVSRL
ncbi:hypothetical protein K439DRAFT_1624284 [Ramaria rubella]|nr:hypothetical protein K439DRAFT_1624284 [Ramaria rubella]